MKLSMLCAALLMGATTVAFAQTPQTSDEAKKDVAAQKTDPLAIQSSSAEQWNVVKGHDKGYVTKADAVPNSWLAQNFKSCDADQDGKVTQAEYEKCSRKE